MKIPKSFQLFGTTIDVVFNDKKMEKECSLGLSEHFKSKITLTKTTNKKKLSDGVVLDSFYHEKVHTILDAMYEHKLSSNEKFVEVFSRLLRQSDETSKF